jgi:Flp pilus assembly protein TadD
VTVAVERSAAPAAVPAAAPEGLIPAEVPAPTATTKAEPAKRTRAPVAARTNATRASRSRPARAADEAEARGLDSLKGAEERFQWGDLEGAERLARAASESLVTSPRAFYVLGVVLLARGNAEKAGSAFERVLELEPGHPDAGAKLRLCHEKNRAARLLTGKPASSR